MDYEFVKEYFAKGVIPGTEKETHGVYITIEWIDIKGKKHHATIFHYQSGDVSEGYMQKLIRKHSKRCNGNCTTDV